MTDPIREIDKIVARLDREAKARPKKGITPSVVRCPQHGAQYACCPPPAKMTNWAGEVFWGRHHCGHLACRQIHAGNCPECEVA